MLERLRAAIHRSPAHHPVPGRPATATGLDALLALEARAAEGVVRVGDPADLPPGANVFGGAVTRFAAPDARAALATGLGMAGGGVRTAVFLSGAELDQGLDLLASAAGRGVPLVAYLVNTARPGAGVSGDTGHEACHAAAETGAVLFLASSVQDAVDLGQVARRVAETELVPAVVALDALETAASEQDYGVPDDAALAAYLGDPRETVHPTGAAQGMAHGKHRRRVPRRTDPGRPALDNPVLDGRAFGLAAAARHAFFQGTLAAGVQAAVQEFGRLTGHEPAPVAAHRQGGAGIVLVTQGAVWEPVLAAVDRARARRVKAGALSLRLLRPFPAEDVAAALAGARVVAVLERTAPAAGGEPPLTREVRAAVTASLGPRRKAPRFVTVFAGVGGAPVRAADLDALFDRLADDAVPGALWLGADLAGRDDTYPKTRVVFDALRRDYPGAEALGVRGTAAPAALPEGAALVVLHGAGDAARAAARLAHGAGKTRVRLRRASPRGGLAEDRLLLGDGTVTDPGPDTPVDALVWLPRPAPSAEAAAGIRSGGALLVERDPAGTWKTLPEAVRARVRDGSLRLFVVPGRPADSGADREERMLGATLALLQRDGCLAANPRKLMGARRGMLPADVADARLDRFQEGWDGLLPFQPGPEPAPAPAPAPREPAASARALKFLDPAADSLPRFWDHVGVRYARGAADGLPADPVLASGVLPPLTSALGARPATATLLPAFVAENCTGCGACWTACAHDAVHAAPIGAQKLLETGMSLVRDHGGSAEPLRMALGKIAARMAADPRPRTAPTALAGALAGFLDGAKLDDDRRAAVTEAAGAVGRELETLPLARTDVFFTRREAARRGSGEFLTLALDPDACTACGACIAACEPDALTAGPRAPGTAAAARAAVVVVDALPAPSPETLAAAAADPKCGPLAAMLLGPARELLAGGDAAEPGSARRLALRQVLGAAAHERAGVLAALRADVEALSGELASRIRDRLAGALPTRDLDALAEGLRAVQRPDVDLGELTAHVEAAFHTERVDTGDMQRLVDAARDVNDVRWRLEEGDRGVGEAPFVVAASLGAAGWLGTFPDHATRLPVILDGGGDVFALARGAGDGQLRRALDAIRALRRGRLELSRPAEAKAETEKLRRLGWNDLTDDERRVCPPLIVFATETDARVHAASLSDVLAGAYPVKVVLAADETSGMGGANGLVTSTGSLESFHGSSRFPAPAHPRAFLLQTAVGHDHLAEGVAAAVRHPGPAWIRVLAPEPAAGGFAPDTLVERVRAAVALDAWPLWRRDPAGPDGAIPPPVIEGFEAETEIIPPEPAPASEDPAAALRAEFDRKLEESRAASRVELARDIQARLRALLVSPGNGN